MRDELVIDPDAALDEILKLDKRITRRIAKADTIPGVTVGGLDAVLGEDRGRVQELTMALHRWLAAGGYPPARWSPSAKVRKLARSRTWRQALCAYCGAYITGNPQDPDGDWTDVSGWSWSGYFVKGDGRHKHYHHPDDRFLVFSELRHTGPARYVAGFKGKRIVVGAETRAEIRKAARDWMQMFCPDGVTLPPDFDEYADLDGAPEEE